MQPGSFAGNKVDGEHSRYQKNLFSPNMSNQRNAKRGSQESEPADQENFYEIHRNSALVNNQIRADDDEESQFESFR